MSDSLRRFDDKAKLRRHLFRPRLKDGFFGQPIESIVDLHRGQLGSVKPQHVFRRETLGIKVSHPRFVTITAGSYPELHSVSRLQLVHNDALNGIMTESYIHSCPDDSQLLSQPPDLKQHS